MYVYIYIHLYIYIYVYIYITQALVFSHFEIDRHLVHQGPVGRHQAIAAVREAGFA